MRGNIALHQTYLTLQPAEVAPSNASPTLIVAVDEQEEALLQPDAIRGG